MVAQQVVDTIALDARRGSPVGVEHLLGSAALPAETVDTGSVDAQEQGVGVPVEDVAHRHHGHLPQCFVLNGSERAVVEGDYAVVEGSQEQYVAHRVVVGAEHVPHVGHLSHLVAFDHEHPVGGPDEHPATHIGHVLSVMALQQQCRTPRFVDVAYPPVEDRP